MNVEINNMLKEFDRLGLPIPARLQDALKDRNYSDYGYGIETAADKLIQELSISKKEEINTITNGDPSVGKMANDFIDDESLDDESLDDER